MLSSIKTKVLRVSGELLLVFLALLTLQSCAQNKSEDMKKIVYVMDPLCGWCYGNSDNITSIYQQFKGSIDFELVVGGMWLGNNAPAGGPGLHQFVISHTPQMVDLTGAEVSLKYFELAADSSYAFSSLEPCAAIALVKSMRPEKTFPFAKEVQKAMFVEGKRLDALDTYLPVLKDLGINSTAFAESWLSDENISAAKKEFARSAVLTRGFPSLICQQDTQTLVLASGYFQKEVVEEKIQELVK